LFEAIPEIKDIYVKAECYDFMSAFQGHHISLAMLFAQTFDGFQTLLGDTWIHVIEHFIRVAFTLPVYGE